MGTAWSRQREPSAKPLRSAPAVNLRRQRRLRRRQGNPLRFRAVRGGRARALRNLFCGPTVPTVSRGGPPFDGWFNSVSREENLERKIGRQRNEGKSKIHQKVRYAMKERRVGQSHGRTPPDVELGSDVGSDVELERLGSSAPRS